MNQLTTLALCLLLAAVVQAAFEDFVVGPETDLADNDLDTELQQLEDEEAYEDEELLVSFQSVERDGIVDTELLLKALMQHAQRLGLSLDELANTADNQLEAVSDQDMDVHGCNARNGEQLLDHAQRPTWRDVIFN
ncbi:uncharacterized protein LOC117592558 [Drosophila guanche]|uniref:Uncharacterized protein n=1 Tax=Drosophila guanche TaxID=7266 RepID=A0A3B0J562_DROGU|nr:uncharacterized protein LOC117592558 [Drosophila guanche]SPP74742.1 Hypothetical predicted protein [Drosophila guanche]